MHVRHLQFEIALPRSREEIFPFFAAAENLEAITPAWLHFALIDPQPGEMQLSARLHYRLRARGIPLKWESEITAWEPPFRFVDEQRRGPYRLWIHEHRFHSAPAGALVVDDLRYSVWGGRLFDWLFVRRDVQRIFEFRQQKLRERFAEK